MSHPSETPDTPDVEAIIQEIRSNISSAETEADEAAPESPEAENNLYEILRRANQIYPVPRPEAKGVKGRLCLCLFATLSEPFQAITTFQAHTVRALNKIVKLLDGTHDDLSSELLTCNRNRMDLIEALSHRVVQLEERMEELENTGSAEDVTP